jgi:hypothetical protein
MTRKPAAIVIAANGAPLKAFPFKRDAAKAIRAACAWIVREKTKGRHYGASIQRTA